MTARYFHKGRGHSIRGQIARDNGGRAWSKIPARLRRGLKSAQAADLGISWEWHHAGKYATEVYVYYPEQVEAYWEIIDAAGITVDELTSRRELQHDIVRGDVSQRERLMSITYAINEASDAAEAVRLRIENGEQIGLTDI